MPLVHALVDIALLIQLRKDLLAAFHMVIVCSADEAVVRYAHQLPQFPDAGDDLVHIGLRRRTLGGGLILDLLAVLVGARQVHDVVALHALIARNGVAHNGGVAVADVQLIAGVIDGRSDVECLFVFHRYGRSFPLRRRAPKRMKPLTQQSKIC